VPPTRALNVETVTHGRVVIRDAVSRPVRGAVAVFHGYAQSAEMILRDLEGIAGLERWTLVAVQGLHRFYTRDNQTVIASWMTRQDRERAIADNIAYVDCAIEAAVPADSKLLFLGYSQGAAMAYRAALSGKRKGAGIIVLGGDVPPDVELTGAPPVIIGAGARDNWYTPDKVRADRARLDAAGVEHEIVTLAAGHEWTDEFRQAAARWIARR
jgi:predicted esterase